MVCIGHGTARRSPCQVGPTFDPVSAVSVHERCALGKATHCLTIQSSDPTRRVSQSRSQTPSAADAAEKVYRDGR